ncbi:MAG: Gfo/Idh/MocA family oxidoreductase [Balneolales bacterium]
MDINRRQFIKKTSLSTAGLGMFTILPSSVWGAKVAPSDQINVALIGCRGHGFGILKHHLDNNDTNCVALCDVDNTVLTERANDVKETYGQSPTLYKDFRKLLEQTDIDAVIIGTPDHWHCLMFVYASQAGKDIYVEKPMANTIGECDIMVKAANRYGRVVQVGQQQRSNIAFKEPMDIINAGEIGKLRQVNIWANFNYGLGTAPSEDTSVPEGVDYDFWLGPAPARPFNTARFHGSWRHYWDYGGGLFSDWGVHLLDVGLWPDNILEGPNKVMTFAGNTSGQAGMRETFDSMNVTYPKENYVINFNMTAGVQEGPWGKSYGLSYVGDKGTIVADRSGYDLYPEWDGDVDEYKTEARSLTDSGSAHNLHVRNFLDCIKTRESPICTPEKGYAAAVHAHIPNIAGRIGENLLEWDDENLRFTNSEKANQYITPEYRAPWTLPKI